MQLVCPTSFSMELESSIEDSDNSKALGWSLLPLVWLASLAEDEDKLKSKALGCSIPPVVLLVSWANKEDGFKLSDSLSPALKTLGWPTGLTVVRDCFAVFCFVTLAGLLVLTSLSDWVNYTGVFVVFILIWRIANTVFWLAKKVWCSLVIGRFRYMPEIMTIKRALCVLE